MNLLVCIHLSDRCLSSLACTSSESKLEVASLRASTYYYRLRIEVLVGQELSKTVATSGCSDLAEWKEAYAALYVGDWSERVIKSDLAVLVLLEINIHTELDELDMLLLARKVCR